jgi:hypothetical protein
MGTSLLISQLMSMYLGMGSPSFGKNTDSGISLAPLDFGEDQKEYWHAAARFAKRVADRGKRGPEAGVSPPFFGVCCKFAL